MLKKILLLGLFFQCLATIAWTGKEDDFGPRNMVETGITRLDFFDQARFRYLNPISNNYISYTRMFKPWHFFVKADHQKYALGFNAEANSIDYVSVSQARIVRLCVGKVLVYKKWFFSPYISLNYRWGYGDYVLASTTWEPPTAVNHYKSLGTGIGGSVNYRLGKRWTLGFETHMDYFFQKNNLMYDYGKSAREDFPNYHPNRLMSVSHLKIGLLF